MFGGVEQILNAIKGCIEQCWMILNPFDRFDGRFFSFQASDTWRLLSTTGYTEFCAEKAGKFSAAGEGVVNKT